MRWLAGAVAGVTLLRLVVAAVIPLAPDEAYYWVWSRALAPGYLDHPPMVALWIRAGTGVLGHTTLGVRLLGPLSAAAASWLLHDTGRRLFPGTRAAEGAVLLLNASLFIGVGSVIMTPDTPLLFFWTAALWALARLAVGGSGLWWLTAGAAGGLALDSKYTAALLWVGGGLWVSLVPAIRPWLRRWHPYAGAGIGLLLFSPVLHWNATHGWAGLIKQGGRVADWQTNRAVGFLGELVAGQAGLATPGVWLLCMIALCLAVNRAWRQREPVWSLLAALSLPPVLVFVQHAFGDRVQGNWPAIIYPALAVAAAGSVRHRFTLIASGLGFAITLIVYAQATTRLLPLPPRLDPIALRLAGWAELAAEVEAQAAAGNARFVAADGYALASELAWSMPGTPTVISLDDRWRLTSLPLAAIGQQTGLLVRNAGGADPPDPREWGDVRLLRVAVRPGSDGRGYAVYSVTRTQSGEARALPR